MIGPGWLPSRPRPLIGARRAWYFSGYLRRRPRKKRGEPMPRTERTADDAGDRLDCRLDGFDTGHAELPTAILQRSAHSKDRLLDGYLRHWLATRSAWLRPRIVPMIVAFAGMFAVMGAGRYLSALARGEVGPAMAITGAGGTREAREAHELRERALETQRLLEAIRRLPPSPTKMCAGFREAGDQPILDLHALALRREVESRPVQPIVVSY